jgi:hypothetical protein
MRYLLRQRRLKRGIIARTFDWQALRQIMTLLRQM